MMPDSSGVSPPHIAPHAGMATGEAVLVDQVLPPRSRRWSPSRWTPRSWWPDLTPATASADHPPTDRDAGRLEIATDGLAAHVRRPLDAPERPAQSPQRDHLLLFGFVQDIAHRHIPPPEGYRRQRLSSSVVVASFQVSTSSRFWVSTEGSRSILT
jgi:hypothetical protein